MTKGQRNLHESKRCVITPRVVQEYERIARRPQETGEMASRSGASKRQTKGAAKPRTDDRPTVTLHRSAIMQTTTVCVAIRSVNGSIGGGWHTSLPCADRAA